MGWGEEHRPHEPSARELLDAYADLEAAARAYLEHRSTGHEDELSDALRRLELTRRALPTGGARVPNSPYPPAPPTIDGVTITRPLNLKGGR